MRAILLLLLVFSRFSQAAETGANVPSASFFQAFLALAFIVGLLFLLAFLGRKVLGGKGFGQGGLRLLGGIALGPRERIVLVDVGETLLVVGIVPGQIRTLHRMPKSETHLKDAQNAPPHPLAQGFTQVLQKFTGPRSDEK